MEERVRELEEVARQLASCELLCRVTTGAEKRENLRELQILKQRANQLRAAIPDYAEKRFWWDVLRLWDSICTLIKTGM